MTRTGAVPGARGAADAKVLDLLAGGVVLHRGRFLDADRLAPERGAVVPLTVRTDGSWVWSEATSYYLREHGVPPAGELVDHLAAHRAPDPTYADLDEIREACDAVLARDARSVRSGHYVRWQGREWRSDQSIFDVPGVLLGYRHPNALAYGCDVVRDQLRRVVPCADLEDSYRVRTEIQIRGEWVDLAGIDDDRYGVWLGDGEQAARLGMPMTEPGVWQQTFPAAAVDKIRETRQLRYDHPRQRPPRQLKQRSDKG